MTNALTAADSVLIPICPEFYSTEGLSDLISSVLKNRRRLNPSIRFEGIVLSRCNLRTNLYRTTRTNVENAFRGEIRVFKTAIPETVKVGDAISRGLTVMEYAPDSKASVAYRAFAKELISYVESTPAQRGTLHVLPGSGACRAGYPCPLLRDTLVASSPVLFPPDTMNYTLSAQICLLVKHTYLHRYICLYCIFTQIDKRGIISS